MDNSIHFYSTDTMLDQDSDVRYPLIIRLLFRCQAAIAWLLLRLEDDYSWQCKALKARILCQHTAFWQFVLRLIGDPLIMRLPFIRGTQKADGSAGFHQKYIFHGMVVRLATIIDFLLICIFRPCYRTLRAILTKKGGASGSLGGGTACRYAWSSLLVRAGSTPWTASAWLRISNNRRTHLLTLG